MLEKMKKSWHAPEQQLIHKFSSLQTLAATELLQTLPDLLDLVEIFQQAKEHRTALPDPVISGFLVFQYEQNLMCPVQQICAIKQSFHHVVAPGYEKYLMDIERQDLREMYCTLYGAENVIHVPLRYIQFHQIKVLEQVYTSTRARTTQSSVILALWPYLSGILNSRLPCKQDIRVGIIENFLLHTPKIKKASQDGDSQVSQVAHLIACVKWYQDHPQKFFFGNGIVLSATVTECTSSASFMPVSRILSRCAFIKTTIQFEYGEDTVCIAIPVRRHYLF